MEVEAAPAVGKRMWSYLRAVFFMVRKGLLSNKRKLLVSMHLLLMKKRRNYKAVSRTVAALLSHHHHHHGHGHGHGGSYSSSNALRRREYEFSCSNSPADFSAAFSSSSRRYFPCLGAENDDDYHYAGAASPSPLAKIEYYHYAAAATSPAPSSPGLLLQELAPGEPEAESCCPSPALQLGGEAFSVRVSNYSSEDEEAGAATAVDDEAEEFIRRFYEQLRSQNTVALLPYMQESAA